MAFGGSTPAERCLALKVLGSDKLDLRRRAFLSRTHPHRRLDLVWHVTYDHDANNADVAGILLSIALQRLERTLKALIVFCQILRTHTKAHACYTPSQRAKI